MTILSQLTNHNFNSICENTKLELYAEAYRNFNRSLYSNDEDPQIREWGRQGEVKYNELMYVLFLLGIREEFDHTFEIDVTTALEKGISYKEAHDERIFTFDRK